jgi:predicted HTH transcriptional regulator
MPSEDLSRVEAKLDILIAIQRAGHAEALDQLTDSLRRDPVARSALAASKTWTGAGELKKQVRAEARVSKPTIERRVADLVSRGILLRRGAGPNVEYRSSGLIEP